METKTNETPVSHQLFEGWEWQGRLDAQKWLVFNRASFGGIENGLHHAWVLAIQGDELVWWGRAPRTCA